MEVKIWKQGQDMEATKLSTGSYRLVFSFPRWTPQWALERLMSLNRSYKVLGKTITIEGIYAYTEEGIVNIRLTLEENPIHVALIYGVLVMATGIVAFFTLKAIYRIVELPFSKPVLGAGLLVVVGLFAVKGLRK